MLDVRRIRAAWTLAALLASSGAAWAQGDDALKAPCDQAAGLLAASKAKEAVALLQPQEAAAAAAKSPSRDRFFYYLGCAAFAAGDDLLAGRSLARLAPFEQPLYAAHARYLLGRIHHRAGELTEAAASYDAVPAAYEKMPPAAKTPPPDWLGDAAVYSAVLLYERKAFPEALARFQLVLGKEKRAAVLDEVRLRVGLCQARIGQGPEALKTLQPLLGHAALARPARWWSAQASATPAEAAEHLKKALEAAEHENGPSTPDVLMALGDALERAGKAAEAVGPYEKLLAGGTRKDEALFRLAGARIAAKQYREAEAAAAQLQQEFPANPLAVEARIVAADVAFLEGKPDEAAKRYEAALPGAAGSSAARARYRLALTLAKAGQTPAALAHLRAIPDADRAGEASGAGLLLAECILKTAAPAEDAADALQAAGLLKDLQEAAGLLERAQTAPPSPELMMKLARTRQQVAALLSEPTEKVQAANAARELYEAFRAQFPNHPMRVVAEYERANCFALAGDPAQALTKFARFRGEPFASHPAAPLALLREAQLLRSVNNPGQAAAVLAECRAKYEEALKKDPARAAWVPLIRFHQAAAMKAAGQGAQALPILDALVKDPAAKDWAEQARSLMKEIKP